MRRSAGKNWRNDLNQPSAEPADRARRADRDIVALGIAAAAILMFVATGLKVLPDAIGAAVGLGNAPDPMLTTGLLLNIALLIFGWRRYSDLQKEVVERRVAEARAHHLADTDALTGCLNRRSIVPRAAQLLGKPGGTVAVLLLDLDNFKQVNDSHGHRAGDEALCLTVSRIEAVLKPGDLVARLGGDEFACVVTVDGDVDEKVERIAAQLIDAVREPYEVDGVSFSFSVSIGVACAESNVTDNGPERTIENLIHCADIAMYQAKKQGKDRFARFESSMRAEKEFREKIEQGIRKGLKHAEFVPFYQQQIELESGKITGFEMLARWQSPELGMVSPDIFVPIAEDMGLIGDLSEQLLAQAFADATSWDNGLCLSVNISPVQLRDPWFAQKILKLLHEKGLQPHRLDIEISESCLHENLPAVQTMVASLRNQGVKISLDDFGMGYANLAQMHELPFDRIKIDRSFVAGRDSAGDDEKLIGAIIALGQSLGLPITAEGIESEGVLAVLRKMGELKGQGFLYGEPADAEETLRRIAEEAGRDAQDRAAAG